MLSSWNVWGKEHSLWVSSVGHTTRFLLWAKSSYNEVCPAVLQREACKPKPAPLTLQEADWSVWEKQKSAGCSCLLFQRGKKDLHPLLQSGCDSTFLCKPFLPTSLQWNEVNYRWIDRFSASHIKMKRQEDCKGLVLWPLIVSQICFWAEWVWNVMAAAE